MRLGGVDAAYRWLILIDGAQNVRVTGRGIIDGRGKILRSQKNIIFVMVRKSSDVLIEGITLLDSPLYNVHPLVSERLVFRNVKIISDQSVHNTDGIDPDGAKDVLIDGCFFYTADDCVSPKTSNAMGLNGDLERLTVRICVLLSRTSAIKFGNETFGGTMRDITFENNDIIEADRAIVVSGNDGHAYENIRFIDTRIETLLPLKHRYPLQFHVRQRKHGNLACRIHHVLVQNMSIEQEYKLPSKLAGFSPEHDVRDVRFVNFVVAGRVRLDAADAGIAIGPFVSGVTFARSDE